MLKKKSPYYFFSQTKGLEYKVFILRLLEELEDQREESANARQAGNGGGQGMFCVWWGSPGPWAASWMAETVPDNCRGLLPLASPSQWVIAASFSALGASTQQCGTFLTFCREQVPLHFPHSQISTLAPQTQPIGEGKTFPSKEIRAEFNYREKKRMIIREEVGRGMAERGDGD